MITLGGGGFLLEAQNLIRTLGLGYEYCYVTGEDCVVPNDLTNARVYLMRPFALFGRPHLWQRVPAFVTALVQAYRSISDSKPDCVICVGTAMAVPLGIASRFLGVHCVFVESIARFRRPSITARLMLRLGLADRLYVQWPDSVELYPGGLYRGTVM